MSDSHPRRSSHPPINCGDRTLGVHAVEAIERLVLVHDYVSEHYDLGNVPELSPLGMEGPGPANIGRVPALDRKALRALGVAANAHRFDLEEGFVET